MFKHWAQPVTHPGWAVIASLAHSITRASGYRLLGSFAHYAWQRATRED